MSNMKIGIQEIHNRPWPLVEDEPPNRVKLLMGFLLDLYGQEDLYLEYINKAESGEAVVDLYNDSVDAQLYPDGRVILEELRYNAQDELDRGPPARIEITLAQAKQLILDWLAAKQRWYAQREPQVAGGSAGGREQA